MSRACLTCGHIHTSSDAVAIGRFGGPVRYVASNGSTPPRATRSEAEADQCDWRVLRSWVEQRPIPTAPPPPQPAERNEPAAKEPPPPFPAAAAETLARAKAWCDFLAQVRFSLAVWELDPEVRAGCEPVMDWIASCHIDPMTEHLRDEAAVLIERSK